MVIKYGIFTYIIGSIPIDLEKSSNIYPIGSMQYLPTWKVNNGRMNKGKCR